MSMFPKRPRKPTRAEQLAGLADALAIEVRRAIDGSAGVQGVMMQLGMLDVVAEVESTVTLTYVPGADKWKQEAPEGPSLRLTAQDDRFLKALRIVADDK